MPATGLNAGGANPAGTAETRPLPPAAILILHPSGQRSRVPLEPIPLLDRTPRRQQPGNPR